MKYTLIHIVVLILMCVPQAFLQEIDSGIDPPLSASSQTPHDLTIPEAVNMALDRNWDIQKAEEYVRQVEGRYIEERAAALPQLSLSGYLTRDFDRLSPENDETTEVFRTIGGGEVTLRQALYTWGQVAAGIRAAKAGIATAQDQLLMFKQTVIRDVVTTSYDILLAQYMHAIAVENLDQKLRHLDEAERRHAAGVATDYDVLAADVAVRNARPDTLKSENALRILNDRLRFLIGAEYPVRITGELFTPDTVAADYAQCLETATDKRPELANIRHTVQIGEELVKIYNALDRPRLDLQAGYGVRQIEIDRETTDDRLWNVGVYLSWSFFDGFRTRGKVAQARNELRGYRIEESKLKDSIALQVRDAVNTLYETEELLRGMEGTVEQAERLLSMAERGYELGVKTHLDVEDAQLNANLAKSNLARAQRDALAARLDMEWVKGTLTRDGIPVNTRAGEAGEPAGTAGSVDETIGGD